MFKVILGLLIGTLITSAVWAGVWWWKSQKELVSPETSSPQAEVKEKPLDKFTFSRMAQAKFTADKIEIGEEIEKNTKITSYKIAYTWDGRKISGMMIVPNLNKDKYPVIVMIRGYAEQQYYQTGMGTRNAAKYMAENGFLTIAPDFLGYGDSDKPENDVWWERFSKPAQVLQLIKSIETLDKADVNKIGIWGHSNGGQIALSVLEITGASYPTSLWAPVSSPFPYSILYFTDTDEDEGQALRHGLSLLEWDYDVREFSVTRYLNRIKAPINLHQGGNDPDVPAIWSNRLSQKLKQSKVEITYNFYPQSDHNLRPDWNSVVARDVTFYNKNLEVK